jgi:hypothetical protein
MPELPDDPATMTPQQRRQEIAAILPKTYGAKAAADSSNRDLMDSYLRSRPSVLLWTWPSNYNVRGERILVVVSEKPRLPRSRIPQAITPVTPSTATRAELRGQVPDLA